MLSVSEVEDAVKFLGRIPGQDFFLSEALSTSSEDRISFSHVFSLERKVHDDGPRFRRFRCNPEYTPSSTISFSISFF